MGEQGKMIIIKKPGLLTSVQDLGRYGYQKYGVIASGVMDPFAHRIANLLVGNAENLPTLEITLQGPIIEFQKDTLISICGGELSPSINGHPVRTWRPIYVKKNSVLQFKLPKSGCRSYLAVSGGFSVSRVMGSHSTYLRAKIGGFHGRALKTNDQLLFGSYSQLSSRMIQQINDSLSNMPFIEINWSVSPDLTTLFSTNTPIRVIKGRQYHLFTDDSQKQLWSHSFTILNQSDRMGYRLQGPTLELKNSEEMLSEAVSFGTIQVPPDGNPIILLADRQTTGGYPKIGQIASVDLSLIAQAKPGDKLQFTEVSHEEAQLLLLEKERKIQQLKNGIFLKFK